MWVDRNLVHVLQVHGSENEAEEASGKLRWSQFFTLIWEAMRMPMLWFFTICGFLWGE